MDEFPNGTNAIVAVLAYTGELCPGQDLCGIWRAALSQQAGTARRAAPPALRPRHAAIAAEPACHLALLALIPP